MGYTPPAWDIRKNSGSIYAIAPQSTNTDDLYIIPNTAGASVAAADSYIVINGRSAIYMMIPSSSYLSMYTAQVESLRMAYASPTLTIESKINDKDLYLKTNGTGVVQYGTYTAGAPAAAGYVTIKAADGTTTKLLATQA